MMVFDLISRKFLLREATAWHGDLLQDVFVDAGLKGLFQVNSDNTFSVYPLDPTGVSLKIETATPSLYGRYIDDELVVWTGDFRFDATQEGASFVGLRFPGAGGDYTLDQFGADHHIPALLRKVISGASA